MKRSLHMLGELLHYTPMFVVQFSGPSILFSRAFPVKTTPVHKIEISHRWREVDRIELEGCAFKTIEKCLDCGEETKRLHLRSSYDNKRPSDVPEGELVVRIRDTIKDLAEATEGYMTLFRQIIADAEYSSFEELEVDIQRRYMGELDAREIPFGQLIVWVSQGTPKFKTKAMLVHKQGSVCNRCDSIVNPPAELTIDHINGNRSDGRLANLQLLCFRCHKKKNDNDNKATELDVSPFRHSGETCVHQITCVETANLRRAYNDQ